MQTIQVIYSRDPTITSYAIRLADRQGGKMCPFSHVVIVSPCGTFVWEALAKKGFVRTPIEEFKSRVGTWKVCRFPVRSRITAYKRAESLVGSKYDLRGALSLQFPWLARGWDDDLHWFCSEALAHISGMFTLEHTRIIGVSYTYALARP